MRIASISCQIVCWSYISNSIYMIRSQFNEKATHRIPRINAAMKTRGLTSDRSSSCLKRLYYSCKSYTALSHTLHYFLNCFFFFMMMILLSSSGFSVNLFSSSWIDLPYSINWSLCSLRVVFFSTMSLVFLWNIGNEILTKDGWHSTWSCF